MSKKKEEDDTPMSVALAVGLGVTVGVVVGATTAILLGDRKRADDGARAPRTPDAVDATDQTDDSNAGVAIGEDDPRARWN